jgi:DUF1365 family protein
MAAPTYRTIPELPAIVTGHVVHRRRSPIRHAFRHGVYLWLVDVDELPRVPWLLRPAAGFDARDHLSGSAAASAASADIRTNLERYLEQRGVRLGDHSRVVMLTNARVLGHVFNPLTVYWCFSTGGALRCIVAEVHNTYGERHAYLLEPDTDGEAHTEKQFYVSPFNDVSGAYRLRFELGADRVCVTVSLDRDDDTVFEAVFEGVPAPATTSVLARAVLRRPLMPLRVAALIRMHGLVLWLRRLPIVDRPPHRPQEGLR